MRMSPGVLISLSLLAIAPAWSADAVQVADPAAENESAWDEAKDGPLPRWREGGTPQPAIDQRLTPFAIRLPQPTDAPTTCGIDPLPEYVPTEGVLFRWSTSAWPEVVTDLVASLTGDPAYDEIAYVVVQNQTVQNIATTQFQNAGADMSKVKFIQKPTETIWLRDYGPHFVWQGGARAVVDSQYYPGRPQDNFLPTLVADDYFREPSYDIGMYYSGGNFQPGAQRNGFVTSLINLDNPATQGFTPELLGELYDAYQGIDTLNIMPQLPFAVDGTGHIDMWMYLVDEDTVIISEFAPGSNATAISITNNAVPYMEALGYEVFRTPDRNCNFNPTTHACNPGTTGVHYTYANAFRVNNRIFIPTYGQGDTDPDNPFPALDAQALAIWQAAAGPGVEIIGINSFAIIPAAGAIHCIVMQVPRYTESAPSSCVTAPAGGEALVAGTEQTITWAASDDLSLSTHDLYYSLDGSNWSPIALATPGNRDSYDWDVPLLESGTVLVKLVSNDGEANADEAVSPGQFTITSALQHVYDFSTGAGVDKFAWGTQTASWTNLDGIRKPAILTQLSAANYTKIATSNATGGDTDTNRYISAIPAGTWESTHVFEFTIVEDPAQIVDIEVLWEGYGDDCHQEELYVWDYVQNQWSDTRGNFNQNYFVDNQAANIDSVLSTHIRSDFNRYIDPTGQMTLLAYGERPGQRSFHDFVSVTVTHEACTGADLDFDGWGDACDNCPAVAALDQTNDDGDARGNVCDCAPADATAFEAPHEILGLRGDSPITFGWNSDAPNSGAGTLYDVVRGTVSDLQSGYGDTCKVSSTALLTLDDTDPLASSAAYYYLVRGTNACGVGTYGNDSAGAERQSAVCP